MRPWEDPPEMPEYDDFSAWRGVLPGKSGPERAQNEAAWEAYKQAQAAWIEGMFPTPKPGLVKTLLATLRSFIGGA